MIEDLFPFIKNIKFIFAVILIGIIILIVVFSTKKKSGMCLTIKCKQEKDAADAAAAKAAAAKASADAAAAKAAAVLALALDDQRKKELADPAAAVFARVSMKYDEMIPNKSYYNPNTKLNYYKSMSVTPSNSTIIRLPYDKVYDNMIYRETYFNTNTKLFYYRA